MDRNSRRYYTRAADTMTVSCTFMTFGYVTFDKYFLIDVSFRCYDRRGLLSRHSVINEKDKGKVYSGISFFSVLPHTKLCTHIAP